MQILTFDGQPASGKTTIRKILRDKYRVIMPEMDYTYQERVAEEIWQKFQSDNKFNPPFLSNIFPLLTFSKIHPEDTRFKYFNAVSIETFYILLYDLTLRVNKDQVDDMFWFFKQIIELNFSYFPMRSYYLKVPLAICQKRRPDFNWSDRGELEHKFLRFWDWLASKTSIQVIDATQPVEDIVAFIVDDAGLTLKYEK